MAFLGRVGNMLRQAVSKQISPETSASRLSIYQAVRCMSSSKVFVGGVSYGTDDRSLEDAFAKYGQVIEARIIVDRETGRSRGFGFVTFESSEAASSAIQGLDGQELHGRRIRVNYANERPRVNYGAGGGGGYNSSFGASGGGYNSSFGASGGGYGGSGYGNSGGEGYGSSGGSYNYGGENSAYPSGNTFDGGNSGDFGSGASNYSVAGGGSGGGSDNLGGSNVGGYEGNTEFGLGDENKFGGSESSSLNDAAGGFGQGDPLDSSFRDEEDDGNFAKRA